MGKIFDDYKNHSIHINIENKLEEINIELESNTYTVDERESLEIFHLLLINIQTSLKNTIFFLPTALLSNLESYIGQLNLPTIKGLLTLNYRNYNNSLNIYSNILIEYSKIPTFKNKNQIKESLDSLIEIFQADKERIRINLQEEITRLREEQDDQLEYLQTEMTNFFQEKSNLEKELEKHKITIQQQQDRMDIIIQDFKTSFDTEKKIRQEELEQIRENNKQRADETLNYMQNKEKEIEKLFRIINKSALSGNSQSYANEAKQSANLFTSISLRLMILSGTIIMIIALLDLYLHNFNWINLFWKAMVTSLILIPAFYCANLAKTQRDREFQLRDFEIKTATFEPFMENLSIEGMENNAITKDSVKLELVKSFFDREFSKTNKHHGDIIIPKDVQNLLTTISKHINFDITQKDK